MKFKAGDIVYAKLDIEASDKYGDTVFVHGVNKVKIIRKFNSLIFDFWVVQLEHPFKDCTKEVFNIAEEDLNTDPIPLLEKAIMKYKANSDIDVHDIKEAVKNISLK